jgi:uncharacterized membrane protein
MEKLLLILHLAVIATGTGMAFASYVNLRVAQGATAEGRSALAMVRNQTMRVGDIVVALIWASGLALFFGVRPEINAWFHAKIAFVILLTICHFMVRRTAAQLARTGDQTLLNRLEVFVSGVWLSALIVIALAVVAFEI